MNPLYWTTSKEGIIMRYSYEFKRKCVEMYHQGIYPDTPEGIDPKRFRGQVRDWVKIEESSGADALRHKGHNRNWTPEDKLELVAKVIAGESNRSVSANAKLMMECYGSGFANIRILVIMDLLIKREDENQRIQI